jgi:DNA polymerase-3 subunit beta
VLSRAAILSNEQFRGVRMVLDGESLTVATQNTEQEEAEETIEANFDGDNRFEIGFNVGYLQDVLGVIEQDQVELQLGDPNGSALMIGKGDTDSQYVVMPMRL